jgi:hypothetical protein
MVKKISSFGFTDNFDKFFEIKKTHFLSFYL